MHSSGTTPRACFALAAFALVGCATSTGAPPGGLAALTDARAAYQRASLGDAAFLAPGELWRAKLALDKAEEAYTVEPNAQRTRDLAALAERRAVLAEAFSETILAEKTAEKARQQLGATSGQLTPAAQLSAETTQPKGKESHPALAKLGMKEEARGRVITISAYILFPAGGEALLPEAAIRLDEIANALKLAGNQIIVEGHTDTSGEPDSNLSQSQRRADAVKWYLVGRGVGLEKIVARGIGGERPIADNGSSVGRISNQRVEIVLPK